MDGHSDKLSEFLRLIPKVEIHCHLLGTIRKQTMKDIAAANGARTTSDEIESFYVRGEKPVGVLHIFRELEGHILMRPEDLHRITYEYLEDASQHTVRHSEIFWNPTGTLQNTDNTYGMLQAGILAGMADAEKDFGISSLLVPSIDREADPSLATEMVELMLENRASTVAGIGIDYSEINHPPEKFQEAYALARNAGLRTTAHAGEFGCPWNNVATALDVLGVDRLDHAYTILDNPELTAHCADQGYVITVVPTNSYYLRTLAPDEWAEKHPIRRMAGAGLKIHPNTDDPAFHLIDPTGCWYSMVQDFGYGLDDLRAFMLNGIQGAWVDEDIKRSWSASWTEEFDQLLATLKPRSN